MIESARSIDDYIATVAPPVREILETMRRAIRAEAPEAGEAIKYRMPTFTLHSRNLVHFAAFTHHIGFFPTASGVAAFADKLTAYKHAKGSIQFPLDRPIPYDLVAAITRFRVAEETARHGRQR
jgi:uncharacterized protein YdhG (YjbR/CyaY superfamily)